MNEKQRPNSFLDSLFARVEGDAQVVKQRPRTVFENRAESLQDFDEIDGASFTDKNDSAGLLNKKYDPGHLNLSAGNEHPFIFTVEPPSHQHQSAFDDRELLAEEKNKSSFINVANTKEPGHSFQNDDRHALMNTESPKIHQPGSPALDDEAKVGSTAEIKPDSLTKNISANNQLDSTQHSQKIPSDDTAVNDAINSELKNIHRSVDELSDVEQKHDEMLQQGLLSFTKNKQQAERRLIDLEHDFGNLLANMDTTSNEKPNQKQQTNASGLPQIDPDSFRISQTKNDNKADHNSPVPTRPYLSPKTSTQQSTQYRSTPQNISISIASVEIKAVNTGLKKDKQKPVKPLAQAQLSLERYLTSHEGNG